MTVYVLKTQLKELWYAPSELEALRRWKHWYRLAMDSGLKPLVVFARRLQPYLAGIVASAGSNRWTALRITTGMASGLTCIIL
jgi:transposase